VTGPRPSLPPSCVLWVDGVRYADGQPAESDTEPVVLSGLRVTWGRDTILDQPAPASCTFTVLDAGGPPRFTDRLHVGARVQVRADALIYPDPTVPTITDPSFEARPAGTVLSVIGVNAGPVTVRTAPVHTGAHAARLEPVDAARRVRVIFPPADLSTDRDPAAWDAVPRTLPGQSWRFGAAVRVPAALAPVAGVILRPAAFSTPWDSPGVTVLPAEATAGPPDAAGWSVFSGLVTPPPGVWLGLALDVYPTGPAWAEVDPPALTWQQLPAALSWADLAATIVDDLLLLAPAAGAALAGEVFTGRVTDLVAQWDPAAAATLVKVTAQDDTAELANRYVGAQPWPAEALAARFDRILTAAGQPLARTVAPSVAAVPVTYRDVDNQPAAGLLAELAQSVAGVLWSATSLVTGPYLLLEDTAARPPLLLLTRGADLVVRIIVAPVVGARGITVSACDVLLEPVRWEQDSTDTATRVAVGWQEQTVDDKGQPKPVGRTVTAVDQAAEAATGRRRVQVSTELAAAAAAVAVADALLGRLSAGGWRVGGLTYRLEPDDLLGPAALAAVMTILDGTTRLGLPILLTDLPDWSPAPLTASVPLYLEGAKLTSTAGRWELDLITSSAAATGSAAAPWEQLPGPWQWVQFDPVIGWADLAGVGVA